MFVHHESMYDMYVRYSLEYSLRILITDERANIMQSTYNIVLHSLCHATKQSMYFM